MKARAGHEARVSKHTSGSSNREQEPREARETGDVEYVECKEVSKLAPRNEPDI